VDAEGAELALIVSAVGARVPADRLSGLRYAIDDHSPALSRVETLAYLASAPKPLDCSPSWDGSVLRLRCRPISENVEREKGAMAESAMRREALARMLGFSEQERHRLVEVHGAGQRYVMSAEAIMQWSIDYCIEIGYAFSTRYPDAAPQFTDVSTILTVSAPVRVWP
jgi:hypothetical protein